MERYFQFSLHAVVLAGVIAIGRTGRLDAVSILLFATGYIASLNQAFRNRPPLVRARGAFWISVAYVAFFPFDALFLSASFVSAVVHLIVFLLAMKLAQEKRDKDRFYLILLSFLLLLAASSLTVELSFVLALVLFMASLVSTLMSFEILRAGRTPPGSPNPRITARLGSTSLWTTVWVVVLGAVLFFLLPRFGTGYFTRAASDSLLVSGFSESVALGEIGQVKLSSGLVMRTRLINGSLIAAPKWRGVALDTFDGSRWYNSTVDRTLIPAIGGDRHTIELTEPSESAMEFEIFLEPLATLALFGPHRIGAIVGNFPGLEQDENDSIFMRIPSNRRIRYHVVSSPPPRTPGDRRPLDIAPPPPGLERYLQLPGDLDPRIGELAESVTASGETTFEKASLVELYLKGNYDYSLTLDWTPGSQPLATFLFDSRNGHCEYFASSMAIMLRTVGIPTRIVNGFLPGEFNSVGGSYIVRQSDAHSWVEVWVPELEWVEFDPTPPDPGGEFSMRLLLSHYFDAFELFWNSYVLTYDAGTRALLLDNASGVVDGLRARISSGIGRTIERVERASDVFFLNLERIVFTSLFWGLAAAGGLAGVAYRRRRWLRIQSKMVGLRIGWLQPDGDVAGELFQRAARLAAAGGRIRAPQETWREWVDGLPDGPRHHLIEKALDVFEKARYGTSNLNGEEFLVLKRTLRDLRRGTV